MKRAYLWVVVAIVAATLLGIAVARHSGYVLIAYDSFRYESSLWATLALVAVLWLVFWGIKTLVEYRASLAQVLENRSFDASERLKRLQAWCAEAEASGVRALQDYSARLKGYALLPA